MLGLLGSSSQLQISSFCLGKKYIPAKHSCLSDLSVSCTAEQDLGLERICGGPFWGISRRSHPGVIAAVHTALVELGYFCKRSRYRKAYFSLSANTKTLGHPLKLISWWFKTDPQKVLFHSNTSLAYGILCTKKWWQPPAFPLSWLCCCADLFGCPYIRWAAKYWWSHHHHMMWWYIFGDHIITTHPGYQVPHCMELDWEVPAHSTTHLRGNTDGH